MKARVKATGEIIDVSDGCVCDTFWESKSRKVANELMKIKKNVV